MNKAELQDKAKSLGLDVLDENGKEFTKPQLQEAIDTFAPDAESEPEVEAEAPVEEVAVAENPTADAVDTIEVVDEEVVEPGPVEQKAEKNELPGIDDATGEEIKQSVGYNLEPFKDNKAIVVISAFRNNKPNGKRDLIKLIDEVVAFDVE